MFGNFECRCCSSFRETVHLCTNKFAVRIRFVLFGHAEMGSWWVDGIFSYFCPRREQKSVARRRQFNKSPLEPIGQSAGNSFKVPDRKTSKSPIFNLAFDFPRPLCPETKAAVGLVPEFKKRSGSESGIIQLVCSTPYPGPEMMASM